MVRGVLVALAVAAVTVLGGCSSQHPSALGQPPTLTGRHWAGELFKSPDGFTSVSARWTVPAVACASGETGYAYSWVGMGGWHEDGALEQIGTLEGCYLGMPRYRSFWEFWPARPAFGDDPTRGVDLHPVAAGDVMTASVTQGSKGVYDVSETNETEGWTITQSGTSPAYSTHLSDDGSGGPGNTTAEVVHEQVPLKQPDLPSYGTITFTQAVASSGGSAPVTPYAIRTIPGHVVTQQAAVQGDRVLVTWVRRS